MSGNAIGGNDTLTGGSSNVFGTTPNTNSLYGDAFDMHGDACGGNDILTGGDGPGFIFGPFFGVTNTLLALPGRGGDDGRATGGNLERNGRSWFHRA
jgi:hypothetical protein